MSSKHRRHARKTHHHSHDASLPHIEVCPTLHRRELHQLPDIVIECQASLPASTKRRLQQRMNFINHQDLRELSCIRIVSTIQSHYKGSLFTTTSGCYWRAWKGRKAEIWLAESLFPPERFSQRLRNWLNWSDSMLDTLFHEIGHHKAEHTRFVGKYKHEAYAEKYMQVYRAAWFRHHGAPRLFRRIYLWGRKVTTSLRQLIHAIFKRETSQENLFLLSLMATRFRKAGKNSVHPLSRKEYRKKFRL